MPRRRWLTAAVLATVAACGGGSIQSPNAPRALACLGRVPGTHDARSLEPYPPEPLPTELVLGQTFGLFYDPRLEQVVLVNGATEDGPDRPTELWRWDGRHGSCLTPPAHRRAASRRSGATPSERSW